MKTMISLSVAVDESNSFLPTDELQHVNSASAAIGDFCDVAILKDKKGVGRWMMVCRDVSNNAQWRVQSFDINGFSGHMVFKTKSAALDTAVQCGFTLRDDDALDRIQNLPSFMLGNYCVDQIARLNVGEITFAQYLELIKSYKVLHGFMTTSKPVSVSQDDGLFQACCMK